MTRIQKLALIVALGAAIWMAPHPADIDRGAWQMFAIFVATLAGIVATPLPMGAVALIGASAGVATGTLSIGEALSGFSNTTLWLVAAAVFLANGFVKTGLGTRIWYWMIATFGRSTLGLGYSLVLTDLVLAPAIASSTARAGGVIFPILQALGRRARDEDPAGGNRTSAFLTLTVYQGTVVTSAMFLTATVVNPLAAQLSAGQGVIISWGTWALAGSVPGIVSLLIVPLVVYRVCGPPAARTLDAQEQATRALAALGAVTRHERSMAVIATLLLAAWIGGSAINLDATAAALLGLSALVISGVLDWDDITGDREAWNLVMWFGLLLMMANQLAQRGLFSWFTQQVGGAFAGIDWMWACLGLGLIYFYSHYLFVSNTAHTSAMFVPFLSVAMALGAPGMLAAMALCAFSSLDACLTHYGTPSGPILFASGNVSLAAWWRAGAILSVIHFVNWSIVGVLWWHFLGLW